MENVQDEKKPTVLLQYGLISGLTSLLVFVIMYLMGTDAFAHPLAMLTYLIPIVFAVLACKKAKAATGYLAFREALKISFGILVITSLFSTVFSFFLFNYIDKAFAERLMQVAIERTQDWMQRFGSSQDQIDKAIQRMMKENQFSAGNLFQSFMIGCILSFIIALIIAAVMKKNKPEFAS